MASQPLSRILVLCRPYLGDTVLSGPVFRNLRAWMPDARIVAGAYPQSAEALAFFPEIDEILPVPRRRSGGRAAYLASWAATLARARQGRFDLVYDLMHTDRSSLVTLATRARQRVGFVRDRRRFRHRVYTYAADWAPELERSHMVDLFLKGLVEIGMPVRTRSISLTVPRAAQDSARRIMDRLLPAPEGPLVVVHPGAGTPNRLWPTDRFAEVCDRLQDESGARVLLVGRAAEAALLAEIRAAMRTMPGVLDVPVSLAEMAGIFQHADLLLGHDAGPAHLAAAVGLPVVALFGAALPSQWAPLGEGHAVVRPPDPCGACAAPGLCRPPNPYHMYCVRRITAAEVTEAVRARLETVRGGV